MSVNEFPIAVGGSSAVRTRRLAAGLSQERLARLADCSTSTVRLVEYGYRPSDEMLSRIAIALGCSREDLEGPGPP
jgi:transcriptional regulator with XRE-family HTH domain